MEKETETAIVRQVEYYFGDLNYPRDKYLRNMGGIDGYTLISSIADFAKMKTITQDLDLVVKALRTSHHLIVSEDGKYVKRRAPLPSKNKPKSMPGTKIQKIDMSLDNLTCIRMTNYKLNSETIKILCDKLLDSKITKLDLRRNTIGPTGAKEIARILASDNTKLDDIFLYFNNIGNEGASYIANSLCVNKTLTKLNLCDNNIGYDGSKSFAEMLQKNQTLTALDLNNNALTDDGVQLMIDSLKGNTTLKSLSLWSTDITDRTALSFIDLLNCFNFSLRKINLRHNNISINLLSTINNILNINKNK